MQEIQGGPTALLDQDYVYFAINTSFSLLHTYHQAEVGVADAMQYILLVTTTVAESTYPSVRLFVCAHVRTRRSQSL